MIKIFDLVAFGARVAVNALVLTATVKVHIVIKPEPVIGTFNAGEQGFGLDFFNQFSINSQITRKKVH
jgi:hypothetical protein